eukprot:g42304.t1
MAPGPPTQRIHLLSPGKLQTRLQSPVMPGKSDFYWNMVANWLLMSLNWLHAAARGRSGDLLVGLRLGLAKPAISGSMQRAMEGVIMADCLLHFLGYVWAGLSLEKEHA